MPRRDASRSGSALTRGRLYILLAVFVATTFPFHAARGANLELHLDATSLGGVLGQGVTYWPDQSPGYFRDAIAPSVAAAPVLEQIDLGAGPFNALRFDGADDNLFAGGFNVPRGDYTVMIVAAVSPGETEGALLSMDPGGWNDLDTAIGVGRMNVLGSTPGATFGMETHGPRLNTVNGLHAGGVQDDDVFRVFWARADGANYTVGVNSGLSASTISSQPGMFGSSGAGLNIGLRQGSDLFDGRIAEIQVWSGALDDAAVFGHVDAFTAKYGLDGSIGGDPRPPVDVPVSAATITVPIASDNASSVWMVARTGPVGSNFTIETPPNVADVALGIDGTWLLATDGILLATINENRVAAPFFTAEVVQEGAFNSATFGFIDALSVATSEVTGGGETNGNVAVVFFPFSGGWTGAHIGGLGGNIEIANNFAQENINSIAAGRYRIDIPGENSQTDGFLFAVGGSNEDNVAVVAAMPDGAWEVGVIDNGGNFPNFEDDDFSFVYIPKDTQNLIAGKVLANGGIDPALSVGSFSVTQLGTGTYELSIDGLLPSDGVLILNHASLVTSGGVTAAEDNFITYATDATNTKFIIESRDFPNAGLQNKDFQFAFVTYDFSLSLPNLPGSPQAGALVPEPTAWSLVLVAIFCGGMFCGGAAKLRRLGSRVLPPLGISIAVILGTLITASSATAQDKKVFVIGVDGLRPDAIGVANTPNIDSLLAGGAFSFTAQGEDLTFSGPNWSTILHGVHRDRHLVNTNSYAGHNLAAWPDFLSRMETFDSDINTMRAISWPNISNQPTLADINFNANDDDVAVVNQVVNQMNAADPDAIFIHMLDVDHAGHSCGDCYQPDSPVYIAEIEQVDSQIGQMLGAMQNRPTFASEDWLVLLVADHGGIGSGHGGNTPIRRTIPFIMNGPSVTAGEIFPPPRNVDVARTVLTHMGIAESHFSDLDGHAVGFAATSPPVAAFGQNLLFNGDAEYDRGFAVNGTFDQYVSGWSDPGLGENNPRMTVVEYGAGHWPSLVAPGPSERGANMFIGGTQDDARITQIVDVANLASQIDAGEVSYDLSAYLGGRDAETDMARVSARFLDANGDLLTFGQIGPVTPTDRGNQTSLLLRSDAGGLPMGTRAIEVTLVMTRLVGVDNDGYADNLSLILSTSSTRIPGDIDNDGDVDRADVAMLVGNFGTTSGATFDDGDFNGDGRVTMADVAIQQSHLSVLVGGSPIAAVPEPGSIVLLAVGLAFVAVCPREWRRRLRRN